MTYTEAIQRALAGDERGFTFLYEETQKSKMYLALQYMKNEDDAMDVLQDSYMKAFAKLDTLQDPEKFPAWLGMIVANTAKNALAKKSPVLFTNMQAESDEEPFEFSIEDEDLSHQPELAYTREETVQLLHEMMDALSEEQKICVLMFHIDGIPIKEIAETLGCSENTVKSRLNYARKNIKKQGEELQKKGYQLYGIAPFTLLLLLLHKDASAMSGESEFLSAEEKLEQEIFKNSSTFMDKSAGSTVSAERAGDPAARTGNAGESAASSSAAGNATADIAAKTVTGAAVKSAFLGTAAGKVTVGVVGAILIGGSAFGVSQVAQYSQNRSTPTAAVQETDETGTLSSETVPETVAGVVVETESEFEKELESAFETEWLVETESETEPDSESETEAIAETESEDTSAFVSISDDEFPDLLEGSLTKEEFEFVLAYGPSSTSALEYEWEDDYYHYFYIAPFCWQAGSPVENLGQSPYGCYCFQLDELNRLLSVFTEYQITEDNDNDSDTEYHISYDVDGDVIWMFENTFNSTAVATITAAGITDADDLVVLYNCHEVIFTSSSQEEVEGDLWADKVAVLRKNENGKYYLVSIDSLTNAYYKEDLADVIAVTSGWDVDIDESETDILAETEAQTEIQLETTAETEGEGQTESETEQVLIIGADLETESESETEFGDTAVVQKVADFEYPDLLEGELTKEELEYVLAYVSDEMEEEELTDEQCSYLLYIFCSTYMDPKYPLTRLGYGADYSQGYLADELNRLFSVFTDYRITEANSSGMVYMTSDTGDSIWLFGITLNYDATATIMETLYSEDEMIVYYDLAFEYAPEAEKEDCSESKAAVLEKNSNGSFQIVRITEAASVSKEELYASSGTETGSDGVSAPDSGTNSETDSGEEIIMIIGEDIGRSSDIGMTDEIRALYEQVLQDVADGKYSFPDAEEAATSGYHNFDYVLDGDQYYYFVSDLDADDVPELVAALMYKIEPYGARVVLYYDCLIFDVESGELQQMDGDASVMTAYLAADGNGFLGLTEYYSGTGQAYISRVSIQSGQIVTKSETTYSQILSGVLSDIYDELTWTEISDLTGLDNVQ